MTKGGDRGSRGGEGYGPVVRCTLIQPRPFSSQRGGRIGGGKTERRTRGPGNKTKSSEEMKYFYSQAGGALGGTDAQNNDPWIGRSCLGKGEFPTECYASE